jgi:CubicO group peptidase (beta-lactamase class C family)
MRLRRRVILLLRSAVFVAVVPFTSQADDDLAGLWEARAIHGPSTYGRLLIRKVDNRYEADIAGLKSRATLEYGRLAFSLADGSRFEGAITDQGDIRGHWIQPPSKLDGNVFATPVTLFADARSWQGEVVPQPDTTTLYLLIEDDDGELSVELINPDRNLGVFQKLSRVDRDGDDITLMGSFRGRGAEQAMLSGVYLPGESVLALRYPWRGGGYDFRRVEPGDAAGFLARQPGAAFRPGQPPRLDDGWETAIPADVGIDAGRIADMIEQHILPAPTSANDLSVHAVLIARHGKLVVEEYFHGYHRDLPHDSRSASKTVVSLLAAAAMHDGLPVDWEMPVYRTLGRNGGPDREGITLRHLVNMNSGLDCDDRDPESAANEDYLWDHATELDFYKHTLDVDLVHKPGEVAAYCSASSNLAGGVIEAAGEESLLSLIDRLIARPLDIERYSMPIPPDGHPYMGGGARWLPRDFLKFPQLVLDGGTWRDRRIMSEKEAARMLTPAVRMDGGRDYGYLWWTEDYVIDGQSIRAHFMGGNGGQIAMLVPSLDLSIVFNAGNYSDGVMFRIQNELIPEYILPAVGE